MTDVSNEYPRYSLKDMAEILLGIGHVLFPEKMTQTDPTITTTVNFKIGIDLGSKMKNGNN